MDSLAALLHALPSVDAAAILASPTGELLLARGRNDAEHPTDFAWAQAYVRDRRVARCEVITFSRDRMRAIQWRGGADRYVLAVDGAVPQSLTVVLQHMSHALRSFATDPPRNTSRAQ